jgi:long-chain fatty acid transport protein
MKRVIVISTLASTLLLATNGDNLISLGAESRAMGGTGIAMGMGTDSVFKNPSWLADIKGTQAMFGATLFMPEVKAKNGNANGQEATSKADTSLIPAVSHAGRISDSIAYGIGMFGVSGMGADYRNENGMTPQENKGLSDMRTNFQYMRFVPSVAYKKENLRVGAGLTLAYGALDMAAVMPTDPQDMSTYKQRGGGMSDDFGFGAQLGAGYTITPNISVGAFYQTEIATEYEDVFDFNMDGVYDDLKLNQPAEYGIGIGFKNSNIRASLDVKQIKWSDADGYDSFGWEDQTVYSLGLEYKTASELALRAGYSHANSPLGDGNFKGATVGGAQMRPQDVTYFNMMGFPAISEDHYTVGLGYKFNNKIGIDIAYVYAPKETLKAMNMQVSNEQQSLSGALKYTFD